MTWDRIASDPSITSSIKSYSFLVMLICRAWEMNVASRVLGVDDGVVFDDRTRSTIRCTPKELANTRKYSYSMCRVLS